jgi:hypothetical protein
MTQAKRSFCRIDGYCRLWLNHPSFGAGWRAVVVYDIGRRLAHIFEPTTGALGAVPKEALRDARPIERPRWRRILRQIATLRRNARAYGWRIADKTLGRIAEAIKGMA